MTTGATGQLGLALPVQGELSGTWGDTVNNGITQYTNLAIAATLTLTNDGAVTLANTTGDASASNITSTLTGAGTVTAQHAIVRVTGTLTTTKVITGPSYSKTYVVINDATGGSVTIKASGQTGVTIAVGDKALVAYNGTDYVRVGASAGGSNTQVQYNSGGNLAGSANLTFDGTNLTANTMTPTNALGVAYGGTGLTTLTANNVMLGNGTSAPSFVAPGSNGNVLTSNGTTWASTAPVAQVYPGAGIANSTGSAWGTSYSTTGSGTVVALATSPTFVTPALGTPSSATLTNATGLPISTGVSGLGTDVATALAVNVGSAGAPVVNGGALGTPSSGTLTNATGLPLSTGVTGTLPIANGGTGTTSTTFVNLTTNVTGTLPVANGGTGVTTSTGSGSTVLSTSPTLVTPVLGTPTSGTLSNCTVDGTNSVGFLNIPQNAQTGSYTLVLADSGKHIYHATGAGAATYTIPANSSVAYAIGTAITFVNLSSTSISIAITTDTMYLAKDGTTGTRTLAQYGSATALKITATNWLISGSALT